MGILINSALFVGQWSIHTSQRVDMDTYITDFEKRYLYELMGKIQADAFIADLTAGVPVQQKYIDIYNEIWTTVNGCKIRSRGMVPMLLGFLYWEFTRKDKVKQTATGPIVSVNEVSREAGFVEANIFGRYNDSIQDYRAIQDYCRRDKINYPDFEGTCKGVALPF